MKKNQISLLPVVSLILAMLSSLMLLYTNTCASDEHNEGSPKQEEKVLSSSQARTETAADYHMVEPIAIILTTSRPSITTKLPIFQCLQGKHFESVIFIDHKKDLEAGSATILARSIETAAGKMEYDAPLAQAVARRTNLKFSFESQAQLDSNTSQVLAKLRSVIGEVSIVVAHVNLENLTQAQGLADALVDTTFGRDILLVGAIDKVITLGKIETLPENRPVLAFDEELEEFISRKGSGDKDKTSYVASQKVAKTLFQAARTLGYNHLLLAPTMSGEGTITEIAVFAYKPLGLADEQKGTLLQIARRSLENYVRTGKEVKPDVTDDTLLKREAGFVTLTQNGALRGCIGTIFPHVPIAEVVNTNAVRAAVSDPRFPRVTANELEQLKVEVTIFTSRMKLVRKIEEIEIGRDGLYIRKGYRSGIFLPQVPVDLGWNRMEYLQHICGKAGLPSDAWKTAQLYRYSAIHFGE